MRIAYSGLPKKLMRFIRKRIFPAIRDRRGEIIFTTDASTILNAQVKASQIIYKFTSDLIGKDLAERILPSSLTFVYNGKDLSFFNFCCFPIGEDRTLIAIPAWCYSKLKGYDILHEVSEALIYIEKRLFLHRVISIDPERLNKAFLTPIINELLHALVDSIRDGLVDWEGLKIFGIELYEQVLQYDLDGLELDKQDTFSEASFYLSSAVISEISERKNLEIKVPSYEEKIFKKSKELFSKSIDQWEREQYISAYLIALGAPVASGALSRALNDKCCSIIQVAKYNDASCFLSIYASGCKEEIVEHKIKELEENLFS